MKIFEAYIFVAFQGQVRVRVTVDGQKVSFDTAQRVHDYNFDCNSENYQRHITCRDYTEAEDLSRFENIFKDFAAERCNHHYLTSETPCRPESVVYIKAVTVYPY